METSLKKEIFETSCQQIEAILPELTESKRRKTAEAITVALLPLLIENSSELSGQLAAMTENHERIRHQFRGHIEQVEIKAKALLEFLIKMGIAKVERDPQKGTILVSKSKLATETVDFINYLNETVRYFYTVVYDIQTDNTIKQASLF